MINYYNKYKFDMFYADLKVWRKNQIMIKKAKLKKKYVTSRDWNHPTTFITQETYENYKYACDGIYDDWDLAIKIKKSGRKIVICNKVLANFCFGGISNKKSIKLAYNRMKERYRVYRKNGYSRWYFLECILMETVKYFAA